MDSGTRSLGPLGRNDEWSLWRKSIHRLVACVAVAASASPALAADQVKIGVGFGMAFLPVYICEDLKLVEKHAKELHLDIKPSYVRFLGAGPMQAAIASGEIDIGPFGTAPLLSAWEKAKGTPDQILAVSGLTTMPLTLLTDRPNKQTIADFNPTDRIAVPTLTAPQIYFLEMQSEKTFGRFDRLSGQVVEQIPANSAAALIAGNGLVTAFFSSPPFTQIAMSGANVHKVLSSADVLNGRASFLMLGATRRYVDAHPQMPEVIVKAIDEAAKLIHNDPRRAAQIYLTHEPSRTLGAGDVEAILRDIKDEFGSPVFGVQAFADFMARHGELKSPPQSWKEIVAPALLNSPST
jgi:NitT/TauT family transport system substrate-binding protein